jgi:hypothetical protein
MENVAVYWSTVLIKRREGRKCWRRHIEHSYYHINSGGQANFFFKSPHIAYPQILGLIPMSQIRKFLSCANPQKANLQIFVINPQIANPHISTKYCTALSQTSPNSSFFNDYILFLRACESFNPQITKNWACKSQIRKVPLLRKVRKSKKLFKSANSRLYN